MKKTVLRVYKCKDEDVPFVCRFAASNLKHDLPVFTGYSPIFNQDFLTRFGADTELAFEIVQPEAEMLLQKTITSRIFGNLDSLADPVNRLSGYSQFSGIDNDDFGITALRKAIRDKNAEGATDSLSLICLNISNFKEKLVEQGLTEDLIAKFVDTSAAIKADKTTQYEIFANRARIVQENIGLFNDLYKQLNKILLAGKILFMSDAVKTKEYTFTELKKRVSRAKSAEPKITEGEIKVPAE